MRTPDKLVDGTYDTYDGRHMWLAPVLPGQVSQQRERKTYSVFDTCLVINIFHTKALATDFFPSIFLANLRNEPNLFLSLFLTL